MPERVLIAAVARNGAIGWQGGLPWRSRADLKRFKARTLGHPLILGRTTFEGLPGPLPGRAVIVLTRRPLLVPEGVHTVTSLAAALALATQLDPDGPHFIGGGASVYQLALTHQAVDTLDITEVDVTPEADAWLPPPDPTRWQVVEDSGWYDPADGGPRLRHLAYRSA
ncbi:MAG: dihydrofolate reductase [Alphaproteobacteria bacterium]|nr:dihydrofolate reductase [Alphaproteobacteria bacterium]